MHIPPCVMCGLKVIVYLSSAEWIIRGYLWTLAISLGIFIILAIAANIGGQRSKYRFLAKFAMIYFATIMGTTLLTPVFLLRPRNVINCKYV